MSVDLDHQIVYYEKSYQGPTSYVTEVFLAMGIFLSQHFGKVEGQYHHVKRNSSYHFPNPENNGEATVDLKKGQPEAGKSTLKVSITLNGGQPLGEVLARDRITAILKDASENVPGLAGLVQKAA